MKHIQPRNTSVDESLTGILTALATMGVGVLLRYYADAIVDGLHGIYKTVKAYIAPTEWDKVIAAVGKDEALNKKVLQMIENKEFRIVHRQKREALIEELPEFKAFVEKNGIDERVAHSIAIQMERTIWNHQEWITDKIKKKFNIDESLNEARPEWHDSEAPDANGRFKELSPKELAAWLIDTRNGDVKRISGALTQQIVFNRNDDPEYADKMEKTREEVYKQLGREDLLESSKLEEEISDYERKDVDYGKLYKNYKYKTMNINRYSPNSYAEKVVSGAMTFLEAMRESKMPYTLLMQLVKKLDKNFKVSFESVNTDMKHIMVFEDFKQSLVVEGDAKPGPDKYMTGLDDKEEEKKEDQIKKQREMDDDDSAAYKEMPGDKEAREEGKVKTSKHVKKYHELYGDDEDKNESVVNEEKAEGDRSPLDNADIEKALKKKSEETGVPIGLIRIIMRRGMAAWKTGHRPGAGQEQWGYARVNSFLTKGDGTWGDADKDVAKEVRDGGYDKGLKS